MNKVLLALLLISMVSSSYADGFQMADYGGKKIYSDTLEISHLAASPLEIKKSLLRVLINKNWGILDHQKELIIAQYKERPKIKISIGDQLISFDEVDTGHSFNPKWVETLKMHLKKDFTYNHHIKIAKTQLNMI